MNIPSKLQPLFAVFVANDDYKYSINKLQGEVVFTKPKKPSLKIDSHGNLNKEAQKKYEVFLNLWLRHGKDFILRLKAKAIMLKVM
ncbi:hypothetical protein B9T31_15065 [Acinetobacter sp. ANC 4558]|uniref:hypothetical protein n=1 Tax=Acinetobacter sp. ANC 4558 TaxID=1977876 RepID=UPI000A33B2ED|nr:hypothetical protein [Acinetobacter sp. ANC 4558]OTG81840.1 hypothetical protein B9T31_15065 [Acinetobacter sp. ANC 4558]